MKLKQGKIYRIIFSDLYYLHKDQTSYRGFKSQITYFKIGDCFQFLNFESSRMLKILHNGEIVYFPYYEAKKNFINWFEEVKKINDTI